MAKEIERIPVRIEVDDLEQAQRLVSWLNSEFREVAGTGWARHVPHPPAPTMGAERATVVVDGLDDVVGVSLLARSLTAWLVNSEPMMVSITVGYGDRQVKIDTGALRGEQAYLATVTRALHARTASKEPDNSISFLTGAPRHVTPRAIVYRDAPDPARAGMTVPVTIYLSDETGHQAVERAVDLLLASAGAEVDERDDPIFGSFFRALRATFRRAASSPEGQEVAKMAAHAADSRFVIAQDAENTSKLSQNVGPIITSLQPTKDAVIRVGALLIVKADWVVVVQQLTSAQQLALDHQPQLAMSPHDVLAALEPHTHGTTVIREQDSSTSAEQVTAYSPAQLPGRRGPSPQNGPNQDLT